MNLKDSLSKTLTKKELGRLVTSFDIVGDIAIMEIPRGLGRKEKKIAEALMKVHKNVRVVAKKGSEISGRFRTRKLKIIAGEKRTETVHKESGCLMKIDVAKAYFSVRLSHERERVAGLVKDGERVLVMFAGAGPFALVIAKKKENANVQVAGIELNPAAARYFAENIKLNKLKNCEAVFGDVRKIITKQKAGNAKLVGWADRVLMPLPMSAEDFLDVALLAAKNNAVIHFYYFGPGEKVFEDAEWAIRNAGKEVNAKIEILNKKIVRPYAPGIAQVVLDFRVGKQKKDYL